jgi:predicted metal-dependent phosphoesterase TrpH
MGKADLHIHSQHGDGLDSIEHILEHVAANTDLDVIAITEHDDLETAHHARNVWSREGYGFDFVPGVEVTTLEGHVVALYIEEPLPSLRHVEETIEAVRRQGGVCFVPHPMSWLTRSIGPGTSPTARFYLDKARCYNDENDRLPSVGASDAHFVQAIGSAHTQFDGESAADLRAALAKGSVSGHRGRFPRLRDVGLRRALSVPIAGLGATPRRLGWRRTAWSFVARYSNQQPATRNRGAR